VGDADLASPYFGAYAGRHAATRFRNVTKLRSEEYGRFVAELVAVRQQAGISQYELARRLGEDQPWVSKYEHSRRKLDVIEFLRVMDALGADPAEFVRRLKWR